MRQLRLARRAAGLLQPAGERLAQHVLAQRVIDETSWRLLKSERKGKSKVWWVWARRCDDAAHYTLDPSRGAETAKTLARLPREIDTWRRKFNYSVSLYKARLRAVAQFQESVRLAGIGLKAGTRTHTEMLDAELDLFRARGGLVRAQADAIEALGKLELASGRTLWKARN